MQVAQSRRYFESIVPNAVVRHVQPPPGFCISRFTPCGRFLVSFDAMRNEVVLHTYRGINLPYSEDNKPSTSEQQPVPPPLAASQVPPPPAADSQIAHLPGPSSQPNIPTGPVTTAPGSSHPAARRARARQQPTFLFEEAFDLHARCAVVTGLDEQLFAFCLSVHSNFLVLASSTPDARPVDGEGGAWLGVSECVTFHLLDMLTGRVLDRLTLRADSVHLTHQGAVSLYEDTMAIVSPGQQAVYLVKVTEEGQFELLRTLGARCREDDADIVAQQEAAEVAWARSRTIDAEEASREASNQERGALPSTAVTDGVGAGTRNTEGYQHVERLARLIMDSTARAELPPFIEGLKQRLLAHLYLDAVEKTQLLAAQNKKYCGQERDAGGRAILPVEHFFYFFKVYSEMEMQGVLLLDSTRILISWTPQANSRDRRVPLYVRGLHMLYDMESTKVERLFEGSSLEFAEWCLETAAAGLGGTPTNDWDRFITPGLWGQHIKRRAAQDPFVRAASSGPPGCQQQQASPYLDSELYQFDDRAVTRDLVPRPPLHRPAKFVARAWPERLRFKFEPEDVMGQAGTAPAIPPYGPRDENGSEVVFLFHPTMPFVMSVVESTETGLAEELTFFLHSS